MTNDRCGSGFNNSMDYRRTRTNGAGGAPTVIGILSLIICHSLLAGVASVAQAAAAQTAESRRIIYYLFRDSLWSANPDGAGARPITRGMLVYAFEVAPDGAHVAFAVGTWRGDRRKRDLVESEVWLVNADGSGLHKLVGPSNIHRPLKRVGHLHWSPDGRSLAFDVAGGRAPRGGGSLFAVHLLEGSVHAVAHGPIRSFEWTPDGQIRYRPALAGDDGQAEWLVSPVGAPHPQAVSSPAPSAVQPPVNASPPSGGMDVTTTPPPLPPGSVPAAQPPSPPTAPPATAGRAPTAWSGAGAD